MGVSASPTTPITTAWIKVNGQTGTVTLASGTYGADITWGSSNALAEPYGCIVGLPGASGALGNSGESVTGLFQHSNWPVSIQCQGAYNDASATVTVITSNPPISGQTLPNTVTITTPPPVISVDDKLSSLSVNGVSVPNFVSSTLSYNYPLPPGTTASQIVTATTNNMNATEIINQAVSPTGSATVLVTAQNGTTTQTYTINFNVLPRLGVTVTQNISKMVQWAGNSTDLGDITLTANGQGPVTLHSLNITFVDGGDNGGDDQDVMTAFLTPAYGFGLKDGAVDVTSPIANGGLAAVATDGSYSGGREIVSWVFPNNNLVISPGSQVTLHLWGNIGNFGSFSVNGEPVIYSTTASIVAQSDIQYSDSLGSIGNLNSLLPNEIPITIYSVEIQPG